MVWGGRRGGGSVCVKKKKMKVERFMKSVIKMHQSGAEMLACVCVCVFLCGFKCVEGGGGGEVWRERGEGGRRTPYVLF